MAKSPYLYFQPDKVGRLANLNLLVRGVVEVSAAAEEASQGRNWWDVLAAVTVALPVAEALAANRARLREGALALPAQAV